MIKIPRILRGVALVVAVGALGPTACVDSNEGDTTYTAPTRSEVMADSTGQSETGFEVQKSESEWREALTSEQYQILREGGTEPAFRNAYWDEKTEGAYHCAGCDQKLFESDTKYKSGTGWPSFYKPASDGAVLTRRDTSHGMVRTEVVCGRCGGHLGHVFEDGPQPTGLRYCMNSAAMQLKPAE